jgi:hypothetical protein
MSDLATQVGAFVGTSIVLFLATMPRKQADDLGIGWVNEDEPAPIKGVKVYSSYHRTQYLRSLSSASNRSTSS